MRFSILCIAVMLISCGGDLNSKKAVVENTEAFVGAAKQGHQPRPGAAPKKPVLPDAEALAKKLFEEMQEYLKEKGRPIDKYGLHEMLDEDLEHFKKNLFTDTGLECRYNGNPGRLVIEGPHPDCKTPHGHMSFCQKGAGNKPKHLPRGGVRGHRLPYIVSGPTACSTPFGVVDFLFELTGAVRRQRELKEQGIKVEYIDVLLDTWERPPGYFDPENLDYYPGYGLPPVKGA